MMTYVLPNVDTDYRDMHGLEKRSVGGEKEKRKGTRS
jgi:hypothetical protein